MQLKGDYSDFFCKMPRRWRCAHIDVLQGCDGPVGVLQLHTQLGHTIQ